MRFNSGKFITLLLILFSTFNYWQKYQIFILIVLKFLHIKSKYGIILEFKYIIGLHCTNPLGRMIILLFATFRLMHLSSLTKIS